MILKFLFLFFRIYWIYGWIVDCLGRMFWVNIKSLMCIWKVLINLPDGFNLP